MNDRVAMGVYQAAAEAGLRIPEDLSVVSFDNSDLAWWLSPGLSSIGLPYFEMGRRAMEIVLGAEPHGRLEKVPMPLFDRASVAGPSAQPLRHPSRDRQPAAGAMFALNRKTFSGSYARLTRASRSNVAPWLALRLPVARLEQAREVEVGAPAHGRRRCRDPRRCSRRRRSDPPSWTPG